MGDLLNVRGYSLNIDYNDYPKPRLVAADFAIDRIKSDITKIDLKKIIGKIDFAENNQ